MNTKERYIRQLVYAASSRFAACETQEDFANQQRLYEALMHERIDELLAAERERCAELRAVAEEAYYTAIHTQHPIRPRLAAALGL